jgi:hypothetical protein
MISECSIPLFLLLSRRRRLLNFSAAAKTNGDCARFDDHRYLPAAIRMLKHAGKTFIVLENVDIFKGNFAPGEVLTGSRSIGSEILPKDQHGFAAHRITPFTNLVTRILL